MKNELYKLTEKIAGEILAKFSSLEFQTTLKELQDVTDTGTFEIVISTDDIDRHGEIVDQKGIDFSNYMTNPVVLWGHNHNQIPVGITDEIYTRTVGAQNQTVAKGRFAAHAFAQELRKLYDDGMLNTSSIGFIPKEYNGNTITKSELLEWSFVSIPANPYALALGKAGYNIAELLAKGVIFEDVKHGDDVVTTPETETPAEVVPPVEETPAETAPDAVVEPVIETPAEEVEEEKSLEEVEEKGEIADTVAESEMRQKKWERFQVIDKLYWAFCEVYFDEETAVEDFDTLVAEFIALLAGTETEGRLVINNEMAELKVKHVDMVMQKAGRVLSSKNKTRITDAILALEEVLAADSQDEEKQTQPDRIKNAEVQAVEDFLTLRKALQQIAGIMTDTLHEAKKDASKYIEVR